MARRNKTVFTAAAGILAALVFGLSISLYLFIQERQALREEKAALQRAIIAERQQAVLREQAEKGLAIERQMRAIAPLGEKLTQAGMLLSQGAFDKAEQLIEDIPLIIPGSCSVFDVIGDQHGRHGEWQAAITNLTKSVRVNPTDHNGFRFLAPLLVHTGRLDAYGKLRNQMLLQFGASRDPVIAERMAKACMILPPPEENLPTLAHMADTAISAGPTDSDWPYFQFVKGFAEYRQRHFAAAVELLQAVIARGGDPTRSAEAYCLLAMAQHLQNQPQKAEAAFSAARDFVANKLQNYQGPNWQDRITAQTLLQEAESLLHPASDAPQAK